MSLQAARIMYQDEHLYKNPNNNKNNMGIISMCKRNNIIYTDGPHKCVFMQVRLCVRAHADATL